MIHYLPFARSLAAVLSLAFIGLIAGFGLALMLMGN
jgi:hypothetical protein